MRYSDEDEIREPPEWVINNIELDRRDWDDDAADAEAFRRFGA